VLATLELTARENNRNSTTYVPVVFEDLVEDTEVFDVTVHAHVRLAVFLLQPKTITTTELIRS